MTENDSSSIDLAAIQPPKVDPSEVPDSNTLAEERALAKAKGKIELDDYARKVKDRGRYTHRLYWLMVVWLLGVMGIIIAVGIHRPTSPPDAKATWTWWVWLSIVVAFSLAALGVWWPRHSVVESDGTVIVSNAGRRRSCARTNRPRGDMPGLRPAVPAAAEHVAAHLSGLLRDSAVRHAAVHAGSVAESCRVAGKQAAVRSGVSAQWQGVVERRRLIAVKMQEEKVMDMLKILAGMTDEQRHAVMWAFRTWVETARLSAYPPMEGWDNFTAEVMHSALLRRLLSGKGALPTPPPLRGSRPDYSAFDAAISKAEVAGERALREFAGDVNDAVTRARVREKVLESILDARIQGVTDVSVVCDELKNPPSVIDANELICGVRLEVRNMELFFTLSMPAAASREKSPPKVELRSANTNPNPAPRQPPPVSQMRPEPQDDNSKAWNLSKPDEECAVQKDMRGHTIDDDVVLEHLRRAWNLFVQLPPTGHHDIEEFHRAIHRAQAVMALRQCRRTDPEFWPVTAKEK